MTRKTTALIATLGYLSAAGYAVAQQQSGRMPEPPFAAIGAELNLGAQAVKNCFPEPSKAGGANGARPARPDMSAVSACLVKAEPSLTQAQVRVALDNNRPETSKR